MNRRIHITALLLALVMAVFAQSTEEQKKKINSIKKSKSYLYAEITTNDQQTANDLAEDMLNQEINKYVAEQKKLRNAANIVLRNRAEVMESISLPRGNMFRAFKYVKKDDIIPADKVEVRTNSGTTVDESGTPVAVTTPTPAAVQASDRHTEAVSRLLSIAKSAELVAQLNKMKQEGLVVSYGKHKEVSNITEHVLVIYNRAGDIEAVLSEGAQRTNLRTGAPDDTANYPGRGALAVKLAN